MNRARPPEQMLFDVTMVCARAKTTVIRSIMDRVSVLRRS